MAFALESLARTHDLSLTIPDVWAGAFSTQLCQAAPNLHSLYLAPRLDIDSLHIPNNIFSRRPTPRLQRVSLRRCVVNWDIPLFTGLREFDLRFPARRLSRAELSQLLRRMPALECLVLANALPPPPLSPQSENTLPANVSLSSLLFLSLEDSDRNCAAFLHELSYQDQTAFHLRCRGSAGKFACLSPFLAKIRGADNATVKKLASLCLDYCGDDGLHVQSWDDLERTGRPCLDLNFEWPRSWDPAGPTGEVLR